MSRPPRIERPVTYPELVLNGPMGHALQVLRKGIAPRDANEMAERVAILRQMTDAGEKGASLDMYLYWVLHQWERNNRPVFAVEGELAWSLAHTEPPMETFDLLPEIPIDGMYITLPPVFDIGDDEVGRHRVEGLFLCVSDVAVPTDGSHASGPIQLIGPENASKFTVKRGITVVGVGEDKAPNLPQRLEENLGWQRDDWVVYFNLVPGERIYFNNGKSAHGQQGVEALTRVVTNFLYLLQNTTEMRQEQDPTQPDLVGDDRKARRERERQYLKGRSVQRHTVWHLSTLDRTRTPAAFDPDAPTITNPTRKVSGHTVLGHIHRYWVVDLAGRKSLSTREVVTKTRGTRTYHLVAKWLLPYVKGEGPTLQTRVLVR